MAHDQDDGCSPFERLRSHYEDIDVVCPEYGYEDSEGEWQAETTSDEIRYRHVCPSCGDARTRTMSIDEEYRSTRSNGPYRRERPKRRATAQMRSPDEPSTG